MEPSLQSSLPQIAGIVLNDLRHYLSIIEPVTYQAPMDLLSGSTIGQHTRHIIEFYNCLIEQNDSTAVPVTGGANTGSRDVPQLTVTSVHSITGGILSSTQIVPQQL